MIKYLTKIASAKVYSFLAGQQNLSWKNVGQVLGNMQLSGSDYDCPVQSGNCFIESKRLSISENDLVKVLV